MEFIVKESYKRHTKKFFFYNLHVGRKHVSAERIELIFFLNVQPLSPFGGQNEMWAL